MESFFRYIEYVDYYKNGEKIKNVGFLRWKLHNDIHFFEIQVKDIGNFKGNYEIREKNTQKRLDEIMMDKGIGNFIGKYPSMSATDGMYINTNDDMLYLCDVKGFIIQLNENEYLSVDVEMKKEKKQEDLDLKSEKKSFIEEDNKYDIIEVVKEEDAQFIEEKKNKDMEVASENVLIEGIVEKYNKQEKQIHIDYDSKSQRENHTDLTSKRKIKIMEPLHEDKWQQLCKEYPKVHPFPDKTFLSIKPKDFIILQQEYQKLVHNSFLLHGFYNYGHMILGKLTEETEAPIYIGVPGVYYEREKQAARLFGFVGFESTEQPVQSGSYGYYMIEVKI